MATLALPNDTVQFYNDGPSIPTTGPLQLAEWHYREAFWKAADEVSLWTIPKILTICEAWDARDRARLAAEVRVPSSILYCNPLLESEQIVYRVGHEVEASRTRGRCQALEMAKRLWWELNDLDMADDVILATVMRPWLARVHQWAINGTYAPRLVPPPRPEDLLTNEQRRLIETLPMVVIPKNCVPPSPAMAPVKPQAPELPVKSLRQLLNEFPELRRPVIHGLLREGETMNVIAGTKIGKSWLVTDLALAIATGRPWLGTFECERGSVLIIDNELHAETSANRIPKVMRARGIELDDVDERLFVVNLRGRLKDIYGLNEYFLTLKPGQYKLIVLDAFYRFMPKDTDENDNGSMSQIYNHLDSLASRLGCAFALIHHSSKGNQSGKTVTDVGAGAGSQSRATDTHLVLRQHEQNDVAVLDAAVRSWPPLSPRCVRWTFPVWTPDDSLDPAELRPERPRRRPRIDPGTQVATEPAWDAGRFVEAFVQDQPVALVSIIQRATSAGLSERKATKLLRQAEGDGLVHRWTFGANQQVQFATQAQEKSKS